MNAIANFTFKSLWTNRVRTVVTIAGVMLAAALLTAVMTSYTSLNGFLYDGEKANAGSWMAKAHNEDGAFLIGQLEAAESDPALTGAATLEDVGFGELTITQQNIYGKYLPIATYSGDIEELCAIKVIEGRLPESADEIILPSVWDMRKDVRIGEDFTIDVGQRRAVAVKNEDAGVGEDEGSVWDEEPVTSIGTVSANEYRYQDATEVTVHDGDLLDSTMGYFEPRYDEGSFTEELFNLESKTFAVVGFYSPYTYAVSTGVGLTALIGGQPAGTGPTSAYLSLQGFDTTDQLEEKVDALFPDDVISYHSGLLRYLGIRGNSSIWSTFFGLAAVLAAVIVVACVSLIYNAFAISVAERSSQFGLLASIGASRRQLRRAVIIEGLIVALVGIPLGLLLGIGGCAVTFYFIGPMISNVLGAEDVSFTVHVAVWALALAALLTLATVVASVFIPAWRTGRMSPIDSIRQNRNGQVSKRGMKRARAAAKVDKLWKSRGVLSRLFGMGGLLARINFKRSNAKGRAASISLALAIVLLMTAGSLNLFIGELISVVNTSAPYDIGVTTQINTDDGATRAELDYYEGVYEEMSNVAGSEGQGWYLSDTMPMIIPDELIADSYKNRQPNGSSDGYRPDGTYISGVAVYYLQDSLFDAFAKSAGVDPKDYYDSQDPQAIAIGRNYSFHDNEYQLARTFETQGTVKIPVAGDYKGTHVDRYATYMWTDKSGETHIELDPVSYDEESYSSLLMDDLDNYGAPIHGIDLDALPLKSLRISCISPDSPEIISQHSEYLQLIVPVSMILDDSIPAPIPIFTAAFDAVDVPHMEVAEDIEDAFDEYAAHAADDVDIVFTSFNDYLSEAESTQTVAFIVNLFCLLFTVILTLIAMGNVFNTVTNGLILRRREFAVMKSIGLSNRQFRAMITDECVNYGLRGLIPGLIVSVGVSYALFRMVGLSMNGGIFTLPWGYMALAIALTAVAMFISVAYGMHRCKADNVVEALRSDSA